MVYGGDDSVGPSAGGGRAPVRIDDDDDRIVVHGSPPRALRGPVIAPWAPRRREVRRDLFGNANGNGIPPFPPL